MTKEHLLAELIKLHSKYSVLKKKSNENSQLCTMWSIENPPDKLEDTKQLNRICKITGKNIEENYAMNLYDMTLREVADSLYNFMLATDNEN